MGRVYWSFADSERHAGPNLRWDRLYLHLVVRCREGGCPSRLWFRKLALEVGLCGVGVCHEVLTQGQQCTGLVVAVGGCTVCQSGRQTGGSLVNGNGNRLSQLGGKETVEVEAVELCGFVIDFDIGQGNGLCGAVQSG